VDAVYDGFGLGYGRIVGNRHFLAGEIDDGVAHTFDLLGIALNGCNTVSAGHSQDRKGQLFLFGHWKFEV
jgi:hypothetical protein